MRTLRTSRHSKRTIALAIGFVVVASALILSRQQQEELVVLAGQASVIDGDTLRVAGQKVRLQGLAAPEMDRAGGQAAKDAMIEIIAGRPVSCQLDGTKTHDRVVGVCSIGDRDVAAELVSRGLARDCPRFSGGRYRDLEPASARILPLPHYCSP